MRRPICLSWFLLFLLLTAVGCGGGGKAAYPVSGTVTFDGQAVEEGDILFVPVPLSSAVEGGKIEGGTFKFQATAGKKRVEIRASRPDPKLKNPMGKPTPVDYIPAKFNSESTLSADVEAKGTNEFKFDLKSK
jgi:hypothetical protein